VLSRRALLGATALALTACNGHRTPRASPDDARVGVTRELEQQLLAAYPPGSADYNTHLAHLHALGGVPSPPPAAPDAGAAAELQRVSVGKLQAFAATAADGSVAALLASIAASHAVLTAATP
jgi:hypothetical protein